MPVGQITTGLITRIGRAALDAILPPLCLTCDQPVIEQGGLCAVCWQRLRFIAAPCCPCCGLPFELAQDDLTCPSCLANPPPFLSARAAVVYDAHSRGVILGLKHADQSHVARPMAQMMRRAGGSELARCDVLAPVPLHWKRLFRRKYNQAALLAQALGKAAGIAVVQDVLLRIRATAPQGHGNAGERARNVRAAFAPNPRRKDFLVGKTIGLIDDVLTTGATAGECVHALRAAGASGVHVFTFARTV